MHRGWGLAAMAAAGVALVPTASAQTLQPGNAEQTIAQLKDSGYHVVIDRVGSAPIEKCVVTSVRNPQEVTQTLVVGKGRDREVVTVVVSRSITVSLNCDL